MAIRGTLAAAVTPLRDGGERLDEGAFAPLVEFYAASGIDGLLMLGTTGEGVLLERDERRRAAELMVGEAGALPVIVHCGAQTTAETSALAAHATEAGAYGVAVIAPPYFAFEADELVEHFAAAAAACAPLPFYVYEYAARSGYAIPLSVIDELRGRASNLVGMKVSDAPFERVAAVSIDRTRRVHRCRGGDSRRSLTRRCRRGVGSRGSVPGGGGGACRRSDPRARGAGAGAAQRALPAPDPSFGEGGAGAARAAGQARCARAVAATGAGGDRRAAGRARGRARHRRAGAHGPRLRSSGPRLRPGRSARRASFGLQP